MPDPTPLRAIDPISGEPTYLKSYSGDGSVLFPRVVERADPISHTKLDQIVQALIQLRQTPFAHRYNLSGGVSAGVAKNSAGLLRGFYVNNLSATADIFLLFFNKITTPNTGDTDFALSPFRVYKSGVLGIGSELFGDGINFGSGIAYGLSSSYTQLTPIDANQAIMSVFYL